MDENAERADGFGKAERSSGKAAKRTESLGEATRSSGNAAKRMAGNGRATRKPGTLRRARRAAMAGVSGMCVPASMSAPYRHRRGK